jgi:hypothetical protein
MSIWNTFLSKVFSLIGMRNLICIALLALNSINCGLAAVTLIGPNLLNGSFESGVAAPWSGSPQVVRDPTFASDGSWYALVQASGSGTARNGPFQFFPTSKENGLTFSLDFDARVGATPFTALDIEFFGRNANGSIIPSVEPIMEFTSLSDSQWQTYHAVFHLPDAWDGTQAQLSFLFERRDAVSGITYSGYLDNIVLQQIPEPSVIVLLTAGLLFCRMPRARRL